MLSFHFGLICHTVTRFPWSVFPLGCIGPLPWLFYSFSPGLNGSLPAARQRFPLLAPVLNRPQVPVISAELWPHQVPRIIRSNGGFFVLSVIERLPINSPHPIFTPAAVRAFSLIAPAQFSQNVCRSLGRRSAPRIPAAPRSALPAAAPPYMCYHIFKYVRHIMLRIYFMNLSKIVTHLLRPRNSPRTSADLWAADPSRVKIRATRCRVAVYVLSHILCIEQIWLRIYFMNLSKINSVVCSL